MTTNTTTESAQAGGERAAFEAWADDQGFLLQCVDLGDDYQDLRTQGPWEAWQARAALPAPPATGHTKAGAVGWCTFCGKTEHVEAECPTIATPAAAVAQPVAEWQYRMRPTWHGGADWCEWTKCSEESASDYQRTPLLHQWAYEVRALYLAASPSCEQSAEGYERYAAIREGHRNAAEDAWFSAIPSIDSRRAFRAGFDAGYNNRSGTKRDEDDQYTLDRSADLLEQYAEFVKRTCPDEIEQHPYLPELEKTAEDLRALAAIQPTEEKGRG